MTPWQAAQQQARKIASSKRKKAAVHRWAALVCQALTGVETLRSKDCGRGQQVSTAREFTNGVSQ